MKEDKIKNMEDFISGLRTSLSRDIGGRENQLISSKYGDLRISSPSGWIIKVDNTTKQQEFKVKYQGAETIKIPNGKISMKITNLEKWDTIGAKEENKSNMNNNEEVIFVWNYSKNLDEIFKKIDDDTKSEISLDSIYILVQVTIGNRSVVQSFELKNEGL